jgi:hypothetical protein
MHAFAASSFSFKILMWKIHHPKSSSTATQETEPPLFKIHHPSTTHKNQLEAKREEEEEKNTKKQKAIIIKRTKFESNSKSKTPNTPHSPNK